VDAPAGLLKRVEDLAWADALGLPRPRAISTRTARQIRRLSYYRECLDRYRLAVDDVRRSAIESYRYEIEELIALALRKLRDLLEESPTPESTLRAIFGVLDRGGFSAKVGVRHEFGEGVNEAVAKRMLDALATLPDAGTQ
jgi:hypothetical protein